MAISSLADLRTAIDGSPTVTAHKQPVAFPFDGANFYQTGWGQIWDYWISGGFPSAGTNPSTANGTQYNKSSAGAISMGTDTAGTYALCSVSANASWVPGYYPPTLTYTMASNTEYFVHVWDRIWANGALPLNTAARQSWTFPALSRYATGEGLSLWFRMYSTIGASNVNITTEYVNSAGVSRTLTSPLPLNDNIVFNPYATVPLPLALGDSGIRSISASTLSASAAGSGSYGFMVAKYLGCYRVCNADSQNAVSLLAGLPQFNGNACLALGIQIGNSATVAAGLGTAAAPGTMPRVTLEAKVVAL